MLFLVKNWFFTDSQVLSDRPSTEVLNDEHVVRAYEETVNGEPGLHMVLRGGVHVFAKHNTAADLAVMGTRGAAFGTPPMLHSSDPVEEIATEAHETNRIYCRSIGDDSVTLWYYATEAQRDSVRAGVRQLLAHPERTPREGHESWLAYKKAAGWVYGPEKDEAAKLHPCMLPYEELPAEQRVKDVLFRTTVLRAAERRGLMLPWSPK